MPEPRVAHISFIDYGGPATFRNSTLLKKLAQGVCTSIPIKSRLANVCFRVSSFAVMWSADAVSRSNQSQKLHLKRRFDYLALMPVAGYGIFLASNENLILTTGPIGPRFRL
jgi:hypothetical protein